MLQIIYLYSLGNITATTYYAVISMGMVILITAVVLIIVIALLLKSKARLQNLLTEKRAAEKVQIYEDIDLSHVINSEENVAYEVCPPKQ